MEIIVPTSRVFVKLERTKEGSWQCASTTCTVEMPIDDRLDSLGGIIANLLRDAYDAGHAEADRRNTLEVL